MTFRINNLHVARFILSFNHVFVVIYKATIFVQKLSKFTWEKNLGMNWWSRVALKIFRTYIFKVNDFFFFFINNYFFLRGGGGGILSTVQSADRFPFVIKYNTGNFITNKYIKINASS